MRHPAACVLSLCSVFALSAFAATPSAQPLPSDWIDPQTGHRVIRLSPDSGGTSLYFHQRAYTPEGDKLVIRGAGGISTVDLKTLGVSPPKHEVVLPNASPIATAWRTREAYYVDRQTGTMMAVHLDTKALREVVKLPPQARNGAYALNCDESLLFGVATDPDGKPMPRKPPPGNPAGSTLEPNWSAGTPKMLYTLNVKSGELKILHRENEWTNHLQASPTDPQQILFCHEGPWHYVDRTWTIRADGSPARLLHERTMNMEIEGHEFFGHDGKWVWYDLQTPMSGVFWLAGVELATGKRVWYNLQRAEWSVHYNISPDGKLFSGDGGGPTSVAARTMDRENIQGQGQWMYLFRPVMTAGSSFRDGKPLIDVGYFKSERLVDMSKHDYSKTTGVEPNGTFTPDGKWLVFSGNFHSPRDAGGKALTHTYAVEIAKVK